jgi:hypothetical protein
MSKIITDKVWKVPAWPLWLGIIFALVGVGFPVNAGASAQPALLAAAVPNDDFDSPLIVTTLPYTNTQDVIDATSAADDPGFPCYYNAKKYNTVWYLYTPSANDTLVFSSVGSAYSPLLAVWTGARGSLVNRACSSVSQLELAVEAGTAYYIEIARLADYIVPAPTHMGVVFSIWPASTPPGAFSKSAPLDEAVYLPSSPSLSWGTSAYSASYAYCYDTIDNDLCDTSWTTTTGKAASLSGLNLNTQYYWQVQASNTSATVTGADGGAWWSFTTLNPADLNHWTGTVTSTTRPVAFDALKDGTHWLNFSIVLSNNGCGVQSPGVSRVEFGGPGMITNRSFNYSNLTNSFSFSGVFDSNTTATGTYTLNSYPVCVWITSPGYCCYEVKSGSGTWSASGPSLFQMRSLYLPQLLK